MLPPNTPTVAALYPPSLLPSIPFPLYTALIIRKVAPAKLVFNDPLDTVRAQLALGFFFAQLIVKRYRITIVA